MSPSLTFKGIELKLLFLKSAITQAEESESQMIMRRRMTMMFLNDLDNTSVLECQVVKILKYY